MSFVFLGKLRIRRIKAADLPVAGQCLGDRRSIWELRFDRLNDLLAAPHQSD